MRTSLIMALKTVRLDRSSNSFYLSLSLSVHHLIVVDFWVVFEAVMLNRIRGTQKEVRNRENRSDHGSQNCAVGLQFKWFLAFLAKTDS